MGNAVNIMASTTRMLKVFLVLEPKQEYVRSIVNQLLTLLYWKGMEDDLPFWDAFVKNPAMFNEEPIEVSFSLLGRSMEHDPMRNDRLHVQKKYRGVRQYLDAKSDFGSEFMDRDTMKSVSGRKDMKKETTRLPQTKSWILEMIKKARYNQYAPYASHAAFKSSYQAALHSVNPLSANNNLPRFFAKDATAVLEAHKAYFTSETESDWAVKTFSSEFDYMGRELEAPMANYGPPPVSVNVAAQEVPEARERKRAKAGDQRGHARRGKHEKQAEESDEASAQESDDGEEVDLVSDMGSNNVIARHNARVVAAAGMENSNPDRFKNRMGAADQPGKDRFESLQADWYKSNGRDKVIPRKIYQRLVDQAITEQAMSIGGRSSRRARAVAGAAGLNNEDGDEREYARALQASMMSDQ
jgi:hypothetical protein